MQAGELAASFDGAVTCADAGLCRVAIGAQADGDGGGLGGDATGQRLGSALRFAHGVLDATPSPLQPGPAYVHR